MNQSVVLFSGEKINNMNFISNRFIRLILQKLKISYLLLMYFMAKEVIYLKVNVSLNRNLEK